MSTPGALLIICELYIHGFMKLEIPTPQLRDSEDLPDATSNGFWPHPGGVYMALLYLRMSPGHDQITLLVHNGHFPSCLEVCGGHGKLLKGMNPPNF